MYLLDHYYIIFLSAFSSRLGDIVMLIGSVLWNFFLWEIRNYQTNNVLKKSECERLLEKITNTYWFCTNCRIYLNTTLMPTGFVVGDGWYLVYIHNFSAGGGSSGRGRSTRNMGSTSSNSSSENQHVSITLYGWWTIQTLLTEDIVKADEKGSYKIISPCIDDNYLKTSDNYNEEHFHSNCDIGKTLILSNYKKNKNGVYFLYGAPGLGKTTTARKLTQKTNGWLCLDFEEFVNHFDRSFVSSFESLYNYVQPTEDSPLIIVLDELEDFLLCPRKYDEEISMNEIDDTKDAMIKNRYVKKKWSRLMDTVSQKKYVMFLLTTNKTKDFFDKIDPALLREHRISKCFHYHEHGVTEIPFLAVSEYELLEKINQEEIKKKQPRRRVGNKKIVYHHL